MLAKQIRALRLANKMSQVELAAALNVTKQSVSNWENDNILPSVEMVVRIADIFSVSVDYLLGLERGRYIDVTGLPEEVVAHLRLLADDLKKSL